MSRGLSPLQKDIIKYVRKKRWITSRLAMKLTDCQNAGQSRNSALRALKRLVRRRLLDWRHKDVSSQTYVYSFPEDADALEHERNEYLQEAKAERRREILQAQETFELQTNGKCSRSRGTYH